MLGGRLVPVFCRREQDQFNARRCVMTGRGFKEVADGHVRPDADVDDEDARSPEMQQASCRIALESGKPNNGSRHPHVHLGSTSAGTPHCR